MEAAGYLKVRKGYIGKRPRTWLSLTPMGRTPSPAIWQHFKPSPTRHRKQVPKLRGQRKPQSGDASRCS
ncbi:transcriptional regulator [Streptomyces sp. NPDC004232]|uniref:transcriptional regulator n=1 Tax=Streptomyces sp. NPDC004232 TaxID=3154454 RepID=UPI0033A93DEB